MSADSIPSAPPLSLFVPAFTDFPDASRDDENDWYDTDHVPQRLTVPGFMCAARYERAPVDTGIAAAPFRYFNIYRLTGPDVLAGDAYRASYEHVTPRTAELTFRLTPPARRDLWIGSRSHAPLGAGRVLNGAPHTLLVVAHPPAASGSAMRALDAENEWLLAMLELPGVLAAWSFLRQDREGANADPGFPAGCGALALAAPEAGSRPATVDLLATRPRWGLPSATWAGVYARRPSPWFATHDVVDPGLS